MVLLVDGDDKPLGTMAKMEAHRQGVLHRAFSVFIFDSSGRMLLQRRASGKYHSAGLWTNACCSHPLADDDITVQAVRRTREEMGITPAGLHEIGTMRYDSVLDKGMIENELDHIMVGYSDETPHPDPEEVAECACISLEGVKRALSANPAAFTVWFRRIVEEFSRTFENCREDRP